MNALVFAAGLGTRLRPITDNMPKALVPVAGVPMLKRVIDKIILAGARRIVVNAHHFASQIADFVAANYPDKPGTPQVLVSDESQLLLDTGGGLLAARPRLDGPDPILVHNADILTDFPIAEMAQAHAESSAVATLLVKQRPTSRYLLLDPGDALAMRGWTNASTGQILPPSLASEIASSGFGPLQQYAFGGVHLLQPSIFTLLQAYADALPHDTPRDLQGRPAFPIMPFYIQACQQAPIRGFIPAAPYLWHDIGKPAALLAASASLTTHA